MFFLQIKIKKSLMLFQNVTKCVGCVVCDNAAMKRCPAQYRKKKKKKNRHESQSAQQRCE